MRPALHSVEVEAAEPHSAEEAEGEDQIGVRRITWGGLGLISLGISGTLSRWGDITLILNKDNLIQWQPVVFRKLMPNLKTRFNANLD
jgi:hypothetical protein